MCTARAIAFCDRPDARSLRAFLTLIFLAMPHLLGLGCMTAGTYQEAVPKRISAVPNDNILDVSGRRRRAISLVSKRAITQSNGSKLYPRFETANDRI